MAFALPAEAHSRTELDEWMDDWIEEARTVGLSIGMIENFLSVRERHPWYFVPSSRTVETPPETPPSGDPSHGRPSSSDQGMGTNVEQWRSLVEAYFGAETPRALCIMSYESGGNPNATNPSSGAAGLFQHLPKYWSERSSKAGWGGANIYDPEANTAVAAWLWSVGGWTHWSPYNRGLCH